MTEDYIHYGPLPVTMDYVTYNELRRMMNYYGIEDESEMVEKLIHERYVRVEKKMMYYID